MNGQPANEYRRTIERLSKELRLCYDSSSTKVQKFNEKCKQKHYYLTHLLAFALSCLKLRRNDRIPTLFSQINLSLQIFRNRTLYFFRKRIRGTDLSDLSEIYRTNNTATAIKSVSFLSNSRYFYI